MRRRCQGRLPSWSPAALRAWALLALSCLVQGALGSGWAASSPTNVTLVEPGDDWLVLEWRAGDHEGLCNFTGWRVEWRAHGSGGAWTAAPDCAPGNRSLTSCNVSELAQNGPHDVRVSEACSNATHDSPPAYAALPLWTLPGEWEIFVGGSENAATVQVDAGQEPLRCWVSNDCCGDEFSFCYGPFRDQLLSLTRTDTPVGWKRQVGWGQPLKLTCLAMSMAPFSPAPLPQPAAEPDSLRIFEPFERGMLAWFYYSSSIGDCECAVPHLQFRYNGSANWSSVGHTCADASYRYCTVSGLEPDTAYEARVQVSCSDESLSSNFTYAPGMVATLPACYWQRDSGRPLEFLCVDGSYCNMTNTTGAGADVDENCCNDRGGRLNCPSSMPVMCASQTCANNTDYCCAVDCSALGGPRHCTRAFIPAKAPVIEDFASYEPANLTVSWSRGIFLSGIFPPCDFEYWHVEVARVYSWGRGPWIYAPNCSKVSGNLKIRVFTCHITPDLGLISMTGYVVRVKEVCQDNSFSSDFKETSSQVVTRPWMALPPTSVSCDGITDASFFTNWVAGDPRECTFVDWQLEMKLIPRYPRWSSIGLYEPFLPGTEWNTTCVTYPRTAQSCQMLGLYSNRDYAIQVRERCTDPHANSAFKNRTAYCRSVAIPSKPVTSFRGVTPQVYSFNVSWVASDPRACLFADWEVQAAPYGSGDWPNASEVSNTSLFSCVLLDREQTSCTIDVGLGSGVYYDARVRERCTEPAFNGPWVYLPSPGFSTLWPVRADTVENLTVTVLWPELLRLDWDIGEPGMCLFTTWLVELSLDDLPSPVWVKQEECAVVENFPRESKSCAIFQGLPFNTAYQLRVREDCIDPNARSLPAIYSIRSRAIVPPEAPYYTLVDATPFTVRMRWVHRFHYDCTFTHYDLQVQLLENGVAAEPWDTGLPQCKFPGERRGPGGWGPECIATGLKSNSPHEIRVWEVCAETEHNLTSDYAIYHFNTPPAWATKHTQIELSDPSENSMLVTFSGATVGDCLNAYPEIEFIARGAENFQRAELFNCSASTYGPFQPHDLLEGSCTAQGMLPDTLYFVRARLGCPNPNWFLTGNWSDAASPLPTLPGCKWSTPSGYANDYECINGTICSGTTCCNDKGGRERCPDSQPVMCANENECADSQDYCCRTNCTSHGGPRPCLPHQWPAKVPEIILNASLAPASLTLIWIAPHYLSGEKSTCVFLRWSVQIARVYSWGQAPWQPVTQCEFTDKERTNCFIGGLVFLTPYVLRLREVCTDPLLTSFYNTTDPIITNGERAGTPANISVVVLDAQSLLIAWDPSTNGDCVFSRWGLEWRRELPFGEWNAVGGNCSGVSDRTASNCTVVGLQQNQPYQLRVREMCDDSRTDSFWGYTGVFRWSEPGKWQVYLGPSPDFRVQANYLRESARCTVVKECCDDQLSVCPTSNATVQHLARIDRVDTPGGWGQLLWLACTATSLAHTLAPKVPASPPAALILLDSTRTGLNARYDTGANIGDCTCAVPRLQLQANGTTLWLDAGGNCSSPAHRDCLVEGLLPDTLYHGRLQVVCSDTSLTSGFVDARNPLPTLPGCWWWPDSGRDAELECADGTFCSMQDDACCNGRGGRLRCPRSKPVMCGNATACAGGQDYCCEVDCALQGGRRPCSDDEVPAKPPILLEVSAVLPRSLHLRWAPAAYLSEKVSPCEFAGWSVEVAEQQGQSLGPWVPAPNCTLASRRAAASCSVEGLRSKTPHHARVRETCTVRELNSLPTVTAQAVTTLAQPAGAPLNLAITNFGATSLAFVWEASTISSDCTFVSWLVERQHWAGGSPGPWVQATECAGATRLNSGCTITGLQTGEAYALRVQERCDDPSAHSPVTATATFRWSDPTSWETRLGPSSAVTAQVDVTQEPGDCSLACPFDGNFSLCYGSTFGRVVTVTRTDAYGGWPDGCWISCAAPDSGAPAPSPGPDVVAAPAPDLLQFFDASYGTVRVRWDVAGGVEPSCECAGLELEVRARGTTAWMTAGGPGCPDWSSRECLVTGLQADTHYDGRMRVTCTDAGLTSGWAHGEASFNTTAACKWVDDSGRDAEFQCKDLSFCDMSNSTCCNGRGGRLRCPRGAPVMCYDDRACAGGRDHCCAVDCAAHGGPRLCTGSGVPAKPPTILQFVSNAAASATITWAEGQYLAGRQSPCFFLRWSVELALVTASGFGPWTVYSSCDIDRTITTCTVSGLVSEANYSVRIAHVCTESDLNSFYTESDSTVRTLPHPAMAPVALACGASSRGQSEDMLMNVSWRPDLAKDCVFISWELDYQLVPYQGAAAQPGAWAQGCVVQGTPRPVMGSCIVGGLVSNRAYLFRVREQCADPNADTGYSNELLCHMPAEPADPVQNLEATGDTYLVQVRWNPGLAWSCVFSAWELELKLATANWTSGEGFNCTVHNRSTSSCTVPVGLGSDTLYDVRVRERCTNGSLTSAWTYLAGGVSTLPPTRAVAPLDLTVADVVPFGLSISWRAGAAGDCVFVAWLAEMTLRGLSNWQEITECSGLPRGQATVSCTMPTAHLTGSSYDVRVRETCTDPNAWSTGSLASDALQLQAARGPVSSIHVVDVSDHWLQISWTPGSVFSGCAPIWLVEWGVPPDGGGSTTYDRSSVCQAVPCNITGLARNTPHLFRIMEACTQPPTIGAWASASMSFWTLPGEWEIYIGSGSQVAVRSDARQPPHRCYVVKECCTDEFVVCHSGTADQTVDVTRADVPGGWGQQIRLHCIAPSQAPFDPPLQLQAAPPASLLLYDPTTSSVRARLPESLGANFSDCYCARPHVELKASGSSAWQAAGACQDLASRECTIGGLADGTEYDGRVQMVCSDAALNSGYTHATFTVRTIHPIYSASGALSASTGSGSRRLMSRDQMILQTRTVLSGMAGVPVSAVYLRVDDSSSPTLLFDYEVATAVVGPNTTDSAAHARADEVVAILGANSSTQPGFSELVQRLQSALPGTSIQVVTAPHSQLRTSAFPMCLAPEPVSGAADDWSPNDCRGRTWSDGPCVVPCAAGYEHQGGDGYRCSATGEWEGEPPRCVTPWETGPWSECSAGCGQMGVQRRSITCPAGRVCESQRPAVQRTCRSTRGCAWVVHDWSSCSSSCGHGSKSRVVSCSSGFDADCSGDRPAGQDSCTDYSGCTWQLSPWGPCSSSCGSGTQSRSVDCPAEDASHCGSQLPSTVQTCRNTTGCQWQLSAWSECSTLCGDGVSTRQVWCPSGSDADCGGSRPLDSATCRVTSGCSWALGPWSACSNDCGPGTQSRTVGCPSGQAADCPGQAPVASRSCYDTGGCVWLTTAWGACTSRCGTGLRARGVICLNGIDADCPSNKPMEQEVCHGVDGCAWDAGEWGACSTSCGVGVRSRPVLCPSGRPADCPATAPPSVEACRNTSACSWRITAWSDCSNGCGSGQKLRNVSCSSGQDADCSVQRPTKVAACHQTSGCGWLLGPWSACNASCGRGFQSRSAVCESANASDCEGGDGPGTLQQCYSTWGCTWQEGAWGNCSSRCGSGSRARSVACSSGNDADCYDRRPPQSQQCRETAGCAWQLSDWGSCNAATCGSGLRLRQASCPSGVAADCGPSPPTSEICRRVSGCVWRTGNWSECSVSCGDGNATRSVTCSGGSDADCLAERPQAWKPCRSLSYCAWRAEPWDPCSAACGQGLQRRAVACPSGNASDCPGAAPRAEQSCHGVAGCRWEAAAWSNCSHACGPGIRTRTLRCGSGRDEDCAQAERPLDRQDCGIQTGTCEWTVGEWGPCSATTCGSSGTRYRQVSCPSASGTAGCPAIRPLPAETCRAVGACDWSVSAWSVCQESCGWGTQVRSVACPGGHASDCPVPAPNASRECHSTAGCRWWIGSWSACSSTCGDGEQSRHVECDGQCQGAGPARVQPCRDSSGCQWTTSAWGGCDSSCGSGRQRRSASCPTGVDADCSAPRPAESRTCHTTGGCAWRASAWSACSAACGPGEQLRTVVCASGHDADCSHLVRPGAVQACNGTRDCAWRLADWSSCSEACGQGLRRRTVGCPSTDEAFCPGPRPADRESCTSGAGCRWALSEWSQCSAQCGAGIQRRNATCLQGGGGCVTPGPVTWQHCHGDRGCSWEPQDWAACSNPCGSGVRVREVRCPGPSMRDCVGSPPVTAEPCYGTSGCEWRASEWSGCGASCGPEVRQVTCSGRNPAACGGQAPAAARACSTANCTTASTGPVTFQLALALPAQPTAAQVTELLAAARAAIAQALQVSLSDVRVWVLSGGSANGAARRLTGATLQLQAEVSHAGTGVVALLASSGGRDLVAQALDAELVARSLPPATVSISSVAATAGSGGTAAPSPTPSDAGGGAQAPAPDSADALPRILGAVAGSVALVALGAGALLLWRSWAQRARYSDKVAAAPGKGEGLMFIEVQTKGHVVDVDPLQVCKTAQAAAKIAGVSAPEPPQAAEGQVGAVATGMRPSRTSDKGLRASAKAAPEPSSMPKAAPATNSEANGLAELQHCLESRGAPKAEEPPRMSIGSPVWTMRPPSSDPPRPETPTRIPSASDPPGGRRSPANGRRSPAAAMPRPPIPVPPTKLPQVGATPPKAASAARQPPSPSPGNEEAAAPSLVRQLPSPSPGREDAARGGRARASAGTHPNGRSLQ